MMNDFFIENVSPTDFDTTVDRLSKEIENKSWKISNIYDLQKTIENHGKIVLPVKIFSLCHPKHSGKILEKDSERIVSSMMPCRVSVYEKYDGKTYISRMNSLIVASSFGGIIEQVMTDSAKEVEEIIEKILQID
ncbi:MAG: hypothetical protein A2X13_09125 [Bacteroidetes bacterium GWC2_33_15]|nr:MAG: hypothetical protein A2X10_01755 [Bacteroidetes bacterium GWA2_33_15]OFX49161.1 MAG: hypothetical protein A2X13_09125 [Bacteroidetes bacterium GWC2_33_15]OFX64930.1 MAG: hypothetical protein A2X15_06000 [Bacteroidetes bacterium GWB2_32_14]OFX68637.1 MAG: hypothetical protein A2X14_14565 [Bacteroidetes bacterium GWD2_33_33]